MDFFENILGVIRIIFGLLFIFFIPGYAVTWIFFTKKEDIAIIIRLALSCVLSIAIVMLSGLFLDFIVGLDTTGLNVTITLVSITFLALIFWQIRKKWKISKNTDNT